MKAYSHFILTDTETRSHGSSLLAHWNEIMAFVSSFVDRSPSHRPEAKMRLIGLLHWASKTEEARSQHVQNPHLNLFSCSLKWRQIERLGFIICFVERCLLIRPVYKFLVDTSVLAPGGQYSTGGIVLFVLYLSSFLEGRSKIIREWESIREGRRR